MLSTDVVMDKTELPAIIDGLAFITFDSGKFISEHKTVGAATTRAYILSKARYTTIRLYAYFHSELGKFSGWTLKGTYTNGKKDKEVS